LIAALRAQLHAGVTCLFKGSRSAGMERVLAALDDDAAAQVVPHEGGAPHVA
jgi:UDP-N-acetylmuramoyl-tripeptide--D-alanyl-D-alanine ligase